MLFYKDEQGHLSTDLRESNRFWGKKEQQVQRHSGRQRPLRLEENQKPVWLEQRAQGGAGAVSER